MLERTNKVLEKIVFESRWLLYPFNFGLILALVAYVFRFVADDYFFITHSFHMNLEDVVVLILGLVDSYMVANLLIMIIKGSYQIFIHKFELSAGKTPGWLDHIDTGLLKVKTSQSIASITGVALLKDFVNIEHIAWELVKHRLIIHAVCLLSAIIMALIWRVTHVNIELHRTPVMAEGIQTNE